MTYRIRVFSIEGNIGAGKTTILEQLEQKYKSDPTIAILREPVDVWTTFCDREGNTMLSKFYENPTKHAFAFQIMAYATRVNSLRELIKSKPECKIILCERSLEADQEIFAKMLFDDQVIEDVHYKIYQTFCNVYTENYRICGIVYIDASPEVCYGRVEKRSRDGEANISLEYLKNCHRYHQTWLVQSTPTCHILRIEADQSAIYRDDDCGMKWIEQIHNFIQ